MNISELTIIHKTINTKLKKYIYNITNSQSEFYNPN